MDVSVVIPCFNAEPYLAQAIGTALDQTRPPLEVLVVDDGSTDASLAVARRFEARWPCVRVFARPNGGAARVRNYGALAASGDALLFLDADDVLAPDALQALQSRLAQHPNGVAACPWYRLEREGDNWVQRPATCARRRPEQDALSAWLTGWYHPPCSVLWSRAAFEQAGRWDEEATVNDDGDLMMRALARGTTLVETSEGAAFYRRLPHGGSLSARRHTRDGLSSRVLILHRLAVLLERTGQLRRYGRALAASFRLIADDALPRHGDLAQRARALARRFGPSTLDRCAGVTRMARRRLLPQRLAPSLRGGIKPPAGAAQFGLHLVEQTLRGPARGETVRSGPDPHRPFPVVSVIVPTFNRAHLLARALDSVLAQTYADFELLVVDDGSTDGTTAVIGRYHDPRIRALRQVRNRGVAAARNIGVRAARGEFLAFLDSDDEWLPEKLARQVALFRERPTQVGLLYTGVESVHADGIRTIERPADRGDVYREMLWRNVIHGGGSNVMIRRQVVAAVGFFEEEVPAIEDYDYWLRITRFFQVDFVDAPLIRYHNAPQPRRRSLARAANLEARWWLYRRHAAEMRRAGVAHLFLLKTVRWALTPPDPDLRAARRLAARAVVEAPTSRMAVAMLLRTAVRGASRMRWVRRHAALD